jgi:hypothetical protein
MSDSWQPLCMSPDELTEWRAGKIGDCQDCLARFRRAMAAEGRCNRRRISGYPPLPPSGDAKLDARRLRDRLRGQRYRDGKRDLFPSLGDSGKLRSPVMDTVKSSTGAS